jgi:hypothetical protein
MHFLPDPSPGFLLQFCLAALAGAVVFLIKPRWVSAIAVIAFVVLVGTILIYNVLGQEFADGRYPFFSSIVYAAFLASWIAAPYVVFGLVAAPFVGLLLSFFRRRAGSSKA